MPSTQKRASKSRRPSSHRFVTSFTSLPGSSSPSAVAALGVAHSAASHIVLDASQALPKPLSQLMPRAPQPRLQRVLGHSELLRRFACRIAFHFAQHKGCAQKRRKLLEVFADDLPELRSGKYLLRVRPL